MRKRARVLLIIGIIIAILLFVKAISFFTAKPRVTVNYVNEYKKITLPENYDLNDNAATYYQQAFDAFVAMPIELQKPYVNWPADFNKTEQVLFEKWLTLNAESFKYFKIATNKPYYWIERKGKEDNNMMGLMFPELSSLRQLTEALMWNAKLNASKGRSKTAFENIVDCYRAGRQKCRTPSLPIEQLAGLGIKRTALFSALVILDRVQVDGTKLKLFQDTLKAESDSDTYVPDFTAEKLLLYDALQRTFVDNGRGTGKLYWGAARGFFTSGSWWYNGWDKLWYVIRHVRWYNTCPHLNCLIGQTKNEMAEKIDKFYASLEPLKTRTPWQLHNQDNYLEKIEAIYRNNSFLGLQVANPREILQLYHEVKTRTESLIVVATILKFKTDNNRFPEKLDELISAGYLKSVPMDPYSDGPLVYKPNMDNFKLYSVGEDFSDDGGLAVFTSSHPSGLRGDIIFWPVRQFEHHRKEFENRKIEKEAESQEKIEEAK